MPARILAFDGSRGDDAGARIAPVSATVHASERDWPGDERAVSRFLAGDVLGFEQIVRHYSGMVFSLAARLVGPSDAEDVVQETFLRAWHSLARFRGESSLKTWLYAIALNRARARHGTLSRLRAVFTPGRTREDDAFASLDDAADPALSPEENAVLTERRRRLREAVRVLPDEFRTTVVLRDLEGLSYEEVAEVLGIPVGTVRSRLARGRALLKEMLS
jgi:RNA polymerase sigma-70 factor (ECF subfamily)